MEEDKRKEELEGNCAEELLEDVGDAGSDGGGGDGAKGKLTFMPDMVMR